MSSIKKSAKDLAFEKERAKFRREIRELEFQNRQLLCEIVETKETLAQKEDALRQKEEWITRLLEYTNLSEEDMERIIEKDKRMTELAENMNAMQSIFGKFALH